jgi:hypothetical protein
MRFRRASFTSFLMASCMAAYAVPSAQAQTAAPAAPPAASGTATAPAAPAPPPPGFWIDGIHLGAQIQGGFTINPQTPDDGVNYGRLFDDRANQPQLNQVLLTINKPTDPNAPGFDWGFKLQGMYGSDARYTHFLGVFDMNPGPGYQNQFDIVEGDVLLHLPFPTDGGMDVKLGMYPTPIGYETIDPSTNPFYSHSYIFNFGLPLKHTGVLTTTHLTPMIDLYLGIDTGVNTTFGVGTGDENSAPAGIAGFGLNLMGGNLTILALTHIGPENSRLLLSSLPPTGYNANGYMRYLSDVVITWKVTDALTSVTEFNWIRDDFDGIFVKGKPGPANAYGVSQYLSYAISDTVTVNARAEVYRDDTGFFVAAFPHNVGIGNNNFVGAELGLPNAFGIGAGQGTTYGEITLGMTFKPSLPAPITGLLIRPEFRVDNALGGGHPFGSNFNSHSMLTIASDFVLTF